MIKLKESGKNDFQPNCINWSYRYLGKVALVTIKKIVPILIFKLSHKVVGIRSHKKLLIMGSHPPKNKIAEKAVIKKKEKSII